MPHNWKNGIFPSLEKYFLKATKTMIYISDKVVFTKFLLKNGEREIPYSLCVYAHYGNFRNSLSFTFHVKSILAAFKRSKTAVLTILEALNFDFWKNFTLENVTNSQNIHNSEQLKSSKSQLLSLWSSQKTAIMAIMTIWAALNFKLLDSLDIFKSEIPKIQSLQNC